MINAIPPKLHDYFKLVTLGGKTTLKKKPFENLQNYFQHCQIAKLLFCFYGGCFLDLFYGIHIRVIVIFSCFYYVYTKLGVDKKTLFSTHYRLSTHFCDVFKVRS